MQERTYSNKERQVMKYLLPTELYKEFSKNRGLILNISRRELASRYKGSFFGLLWSFLNPLMLLVIYTFVFTVIFEARWGTTISSRYDFALALYSGLIVFTLFSENINRAPTIIVNNPNYVKKVVFPVQILPITSLLQSLFQFFISFLILMSAMILAGKPITYQIYLLPILLLPLLFLTLGLNYLLSALGVFIRDIVFTIGIVVNMLFFLTPIFYPVDAVPDGFRSFMYINPLTYLVESVRNLILNGAVPNGVVFILYLVGCYLFLQLCYFWFMLTRRGFADVL